MLLSGYPQATLPGHPVVSSFLEMPASSDRLFLTVYTAAVGPTPARPPPFIARPTFRVHFVFVFGFATSLMELDGHNGLMRKSGC